MSIHVAIGEASLKSGCKSVCYALLGLSDWSTGAGIEASIGTISHRAGLKSRATLNALNALEALGVVIFDRRSRGGLRRGGAGVVHRLSLHVPTLLRLNPAESAGINPAENASKPRSSRQNTPQKTAESPAESAYNQNSPKQSKTPPPEPAGGDGAVDHRAEHGNDEVFKALIAIGVGATNARGLARKHSLAEVVAAGAWVDENASTAKSKAAVVVTALRDGTAALALARRDSAGAPPTRGDRQHGWDNPMRGAH